MIKVAINGFGRIGRCALRQILNRNDMQVVAINGLSDTLDLAYLFKYDSVHRTSSQRVGFDENNIIIGDKKIRVFRESDPANIPWGELDVDVVLECTGVFNSKEKCMAHINSGAKKVVISAPTKDYCKTIVYSVNDNIITKEDNIVSAASCTTNCLAPVLKVINDNFGVVSGFMTTVHAITNDQSLLDNSHKKGIESRRGRAAYSNIIPTSTGAAKSIGKVIPELEGKLDGLAYRVPVTDGSILDLTVLVNKDTNEKEVNECLKNNQNESLRVISIPLVSSDVIGVEAGAVVDALLTKVIKTDGKTMLKVTAWYDNEWGYTAQMIRVAAKLFNC